MISSAIFFVCLAVALLELDTTYAFQLTFSRGIIAGPILGLITGDFIGGLQIGIFTELLFADISPLGGILPPSAVGCCGVSLALHYLGIPLYISFFFGVLCALVLAYAERTARKRRCRWVVFWEQRILKNPSCVNKAVALSLLASFGSTFLLFTVLLSLAAGVTAWIVPYLSDQAHLAFKFAYVAVPWIGIATLIASFRLKTR